MKINKQGFSLIETLLYLAILSVVGALMTGILTNVVRINVQETSGNEVTSQLNSVMQNINSLIRQSSNIEIATSTMVTALKLRMSDKAKDPTCIYIASSTIKLAQGPDATNPQNCASATSDLTTSKVTADRLNFQKITYYPGHDTVSVDIQLSYNSTNPQAQISRALQTTIGRVSAATFDDNLVPGSSNAYDVGLSGSLWRSINNQIYFSGSNIGIGTTGPLSKLDINGGVAIGTYAGNNAAPTNGLIVSGNVGIGTTTPAYKLDVLGQINSSAGLCMAGDCKTSWSGISASPGGSNTQIQFNNNGTFGGDSNLTWASSTKLLNVNGKVFIQGSINRGPTNLPLFRWLPTGATTTYTGIGGGPRGIAFDGTNMWTTNYANSSVAKITPTGATTTYTGTGANSYGIAFDGTNMWTTNYANSSVAKITPTGATTTYTGIGSGPWGIAFDGTNMWTANNNGNSVTKITPTGATTTYTGIGANPWGIAFDGTNMWTANTGGNSVTKITPTGATTTYTGTGASPTGIAFDGTNMWTANNNGSSVTKITPTGATTTYTGTGADPVGIAFDGTNMWTANYTGNSVTKITPTGAMTTYTGTGANPYGIAFDGTNMWTTNYTGNSVTKILVNTNTQ